MGTNSFEFGKSIMSESEKTLLTNNFQIIGIQNSRFSNFESDKEWKHRQYSVTYPWFDMGSTREETLYMKITALDGAKLNETFPEEMREESMTLRTWAIFTTYGSLAFRKLFNKKPTEEEIEKTLERIISDIYPNVSTDAILVNKIMEAQHKEVI